MRREREYNEQREQPKRVENAAKVSKNNAFALLDADESSDDEAADNRLQVRKQEKARAMQQQERLRALDTPAADIVVMLESKPSWPLAGQKASAMNWADWSDDEDLSEQDKN
jgi:fructoselysine-6-P-deglycase FrlB-like protein